jgi:hypothetical protein
MPSRIAMSISSLAVAGGIVFCGAEQAKADAPDVSADMCGAVALAKFLQWTQAKLMVEQTNTFADGSKRGMELIVTENTAYARFGHFWKTANVTRPERGVANPQLLAKKMGLAICAKSDHVQAAAGPATVYTYSYKPDDDGTVSKGTLWVSDATGLPARQEFDQNGPLATSHMATTIETTYAYNDDVTVPRGAELAENTRLFRNRMPFSFGQFAFADGAR